MMKKLSTALILFVLFSIISLGVSATKAVITNTSTGFNIYDDLSELTIDPDLYNEVNNGAFTLTGSEFRCQGTGSALWHNIIINNTDYILDPKDEWTITYVAYTGSGADGDWSSIQPQVKNQSNTIANDGFDKIYFYYNNGADIYTLEELNGVARQQNAGIATYLTTTKKNFTMTKTNNILLDTFNLEFLVNGVSLQNFTSQYNISEYPDEPWFFAPLICQKNSFDDHKTFYDEYNLTVTRYTTSFGQTDTVVSSPTTNIRDNQPLQVIYKFTDNDSPYANCSLIVDGSINLTNISLNNNTETTFSPSLTDGIHSWYVSCSDGENESNSTILYYDLDTSQPFIQSESPSVFNDTIFTSYTMNIVGNVTDNSIYRVNRTIYYPNATVFYNNYSGDLSANTTLYDWDDTFNTTLMPNGVYSMFIESADSHTNKYFPPVLSVAKDNTARKLSFDFADDDITIALVGGNVLGQFDTIDTTKLEDRYTFDLQFKNTITPNSIMVFRITSTKSIVYLADSEYTAHFIIADSYWMDFEGVEGDVTVTMIDESTYDIEIRTANPQDKFVFHSLGGLNEDNLSLEFEINNCVPDWTCIGYDACNTSDQQTCNSVSDLNVCGLAYGGDYSEFPIGVCNYCDSDVQLFNQTDCVLHVSLYTYIDNNFTTCCNLTSLPSDCPQATEYYSVNTSCSQFSYDEGDVAPALIDLSAKFFILVGQWVALMLIGVIIIWALVSLGVKKYK